jgi:hypothetical protein
MRTPTYTNVRTHDHTTPTGVRRVCTTDASGVTHITYPTYPRTYAASARSARTYRRHTTRRRCRYLMAAARRTIVRATGWACLVAATIVVSVLASSYTALHITDRLNNTPPPMPTYTRSAQCPTEDSCIPVWNGHTYTWTPVIP